MLDDVELQLNDSIEQFYTTISSKSPQKPPRRAKVCQNMYFCPLIAMPFKALTGYH